MISLMFVFYSMLFSINNPVLPDCENKLKELNYTYEYNQEPAVMPHTKTLDSYNRYSLDTIPRSVKLEVISMYNCFKLNLKADTNKVLLISYYPLFELTDNKEEAEKLEIAYYQRFYKIGKFIDFHKLKKYKIYSKIDKNKEAKSKYKIELLDQGNSKLTSKGSKLWEECKTCPF